VHFKCNIKLESAFSNRLGEETGQVEDLKGLLSLKNVSYDIEMKYEPELSVTS